MVNKPEYQKAYYRRNVEKEAARAREKALRTKYGITEEQYEEILHRQQGCCAICERPVAVFKRRLAVDHDHHTGEIRGALCINCNRYLIGRRRGPEGVAIFRKAANYLEGPYTGWIVPPKKKRKKRVARRTGRRSNKKGAVMVRPEVQEKLRSPSKVRQGRQALDVADHLRHSRTRAAYAVRYDRGYD